METIAPSKGIYGNFQNFHRGVTGGEGRFGLPHCCCYTWNMFAPGGNSNRGALKVHSNRFVAPAQVVVQKGFTYREETEIVLRSDKAMPLVGIEHISNGYFLLLHRLHNLVRFCLFDPGVIGSLTD